MLDRTDPIRGQIHRQALSIALAVTPFGVTFGVAASEAGLELWEASAFSLLVFTGSAQFAAVDVVGDGGAAVTAVLAGLLLNLRSLAFGVAMATTLRGPVWRRALASQLMIDESAAVGLAQPERWREYGYLAAGLGVFVTWNIATILGASVVSSAGNVVDSWGLDAAIPAAFLALLWPRLKDPEGRRAAAAGVALALALTPFAPAGVPIVVAALGVVVAGRQS